MFGILATQLEKRQALRKDTRLVVEQLRRIAIEAGFIGLKFGGPGATEQQLDACDEDSNDGNCKEDQKSEAGSSGVPKAGPSGGTKRLRNK